MSDLARIETARTGTTQLVRVAGEVDLSNAAELTASVAHDVPDEVTLVILDLTHTTYVDSATIATLFRLAERLRNRRQELRLVVPQESPIRAVLELTRLSQVIPVDDVAPPPPRQELPMTYDPHGFLTEPATTPEVEALYEGDVADHGYVMNLSRVWAQSPAAHDALFALLGDMVALGGLTFRQRGILVSATASTIGDSYCALAWGARLATEAGEEVAGAVLRGDVHALDPADAALATWARAVAHDANATTEADLAPLRAAGFDDRQVFAITVFVALRRAFSTVNDALGPQPDRQLRDDAPTAVSDAVSFGRPSAPTPS